MAHYPSKQALIEQLGLTPHVEGGYYKRSFQSEQTTALTEGALRHLMSSIFYLLTDDQPIGHFHRNQSTIIHYWQAGEALTYWLINTNAELSCVRLGPNIEAGEQLQLIVPGGFWKASELTQGEYGLISEAVCPGFDINDMVLANATSMAEHYPQHWPKITHLCKS